MALASPVVPPTHHFRIDGVCFLFFFCLMLFRFLPSLAERWNEPVELMGAALPFCKR